MPKKRAKKSLTLRKTVKKPGKRYHSVDNRKVNKKNQKKIQTNIEKTTSLKNNRKRLTTQKTLKNRRQSESKQEIPKENSNIH